MSDSLINRIKTTNNELILPNGKIITLNQEQFDGLNKINQWIDSDKRYFTLAGYAGTGKTTIVKKILDSYFGGVVVSAPTHKAKKVVINTTKKQGQTLHGLLGLRPDLNLDDFNPNDPKFNPIALPRITDYNLVVIDEASMINEELYGLIIDKTKKSRTKVLYMGDPAQIPPVGEKESVVFNRETNLGIFHQLTKIERQNDTNPLAIIYDSLRNNLNDPDGGIKRISNINHLNEGIDFTISKRDFRRKLLNQFSSVEYSKDTDYTKLIAWKNDTVMKSNAVIRKELFGDDIPNVVVGDILMGYRSISDEGMRGNIIENSGDYKVMDVSSRKENELGIKGYVVKLRENMPNGGFSFTDVFIIDINDRDNLFLYADMHDFFKNISKADKKNWKKYYNFRRNNILMKTIDINRNGTFRNNYDIIAKDIDYGYAITAHKSQGSTYTHVCVMENDINNNWLVKERNQIKYVSLTRPTKTATILTTKLD